MGLLGGITDAFRNIPGLNVISNIADLTTSMMKGDFAGMLNAASQLAITYATGGTGALFGQVSSLLSNLASQTLTGAAGNVIGQVGMDGASNMLTRALSGAMGLEAGIGAIAMIGEQMGLPQSAIDAAQGAFASSMGEHSVAREEYGEAGMYKKGGLFRRTDNVSSTEREQANAFLDMIKGNAPQAGQPQLSIGDMLGALIAGPGAGAVQLGQAMGLIAGFQTAVNNLASGLGESLSNDNTAARGAGNERAERSGNDEIDKFVNNAARGNDQRRAEGDPDVPQSGEVEGEGFLVALAKLLGKVIDGKMGDMMDKAKEIEQIKKEDDEDPVIATKGAELNALSKEIDMLSNALKSSIDSLGQATSTLARKN